jgi:TolB-like protein
MQVVPLPEPRSRPVAPQGPDALLPNAVPPDVKLARKKKDKVRSAWISFAGRIVAQVTGAIVSVALTLMVVHKVQHGPDTTAAPAEPSRVQAAATLPAGTLSSTGRSDASLREPAVAVLPLDNFSGDPAQDAFANSMTEALIADLAQIPGLTVISRTSSMQYRGTRKPLPEIARELGATHLIEGSLVRDRARLRVTAQLIDAASDRHLWAHTYDHPVGSVLDVQADVADTIAQDIGAALAAR